MCGGRGGVGAIIPPRLIISGLINYPYLIITIELSHRQVKYSLVGGDVSDVHKSDNIKN